MRINVDGFQGFCTNPLSDNALFTKLRGIQFDLAVVDSFVGSRFSFSSKLSTVGHSCASILQILQKPQRNDAK